MRALFCCIGLLLLVLAHSSCQKTGFATKYGIFHVENDTTVVVNGTIRGRTEKHWDNLCEDYPDIRLMILEDCPGSNNDAANFRMATRIHSKGINMHLRSHSTIESGAVDLFLAGTQRTREQGAKVGVHSWSSWRTEGADLPADDPEHTEYLCYYTGIGMTKEAAEAFYWFTLRAAPSDGMHFMSEAELATYNVFTNE